MHVNNRLGRVLKAYVEGVKGHATTIATAVTLSALLNWIGPRIAIAVVVVLMASLVWKSGIRICVVRNRTMKEGEANDHEYHTAEE